MTFRIKIVVKMKNSWFIILVCMIALTLPSCKKGNPKVIIKGDISNLEVPYVLATHFSADTFAIDTIKVSGKGHFRYAVPIDTLTSFTLYFNNFNSSTVVFADKGQKITLTGDADLPDLIQVKGNEINEDLSIFKKENSALLEQRSQIINNSKKDEKREKVIGVLNEADKIAKINSLNHELMQRAETFIKANPEKMASVILINEFFRDNENPQSLERALGYLKGNALESPLAADLKIYLEELKQSAEGAYIPYFQLTDLQNKTILSSDFKGKYLLISFLSAGDNESREAIRILKKEYKQLNKDSVKFMSIYIDSDVYPISAIKNDSIPWTTVAEKKSWASDIVKTFHVEFVPYNILITPDGKIKNRNISAIDISKSIKEEVKSN